MKFIQDNRKLADQLKPLGLKAKVHVDGNIKTIEIFESNGTISAATIPKELRDHIEKQGFKEVV